MLSLCLMLLLQQAGPPATQPQPPTPPKQPAVSPAPTYDHGPLRIEITAMFDARYWFQEEQPGTRESDLRMQLRISGQRITEIARVGTVILDEATDDTGKALVAPDSQTDEEREATRPVNLAPERLRSTGLLLTAGMGSPNRAAKSVKLRGSVRLILAEGHEEITIDNPLQYVGQTLAHERLKELGVEIRVVSPAELADEQPPSAASTFSIQYVKGQEHVRSLGFYNGWMSVIRHRERPLKTKDGQAVVGCGLIGAELNGDSQLVIDVYPRVDDIQLPIEIDELKLP